MKPIVVIMAKAPVPGKVKTRLSPALSPSQAAELYSCFIQDTVEEMAQLTDTGDDSGFSPTLALAYAPRGAEAAFTALLPVALPMMVQQGSDLGQRMAFVFQTLFDEGYDQVHLIGSDSPDLPRGIVGQAIQALAHPRTDLVLGPSGDGGYYLIGLKRPAPALFEKIPWSTERVLETTLHCARRRDLSYALLAPWDDIDTPGDLARFFARNKDRTDKCPGWRTLAFLGRLR